MTQYKILRKATGFVIAPVATLALFITNMDTILSFLHLKNYKAPLVSAQGIIPHGAFGAVYGVTNVSDYHYELYAFPSTSNPYFSATNYSSAPILSFSITNPNNLDMAINSVVIEAIPITTNKVSIGIGPMIGGADFFLYECLISTNETCSTAQYKMEGSDFLKLSPGELSTIRVFIRSSSLGLYKIRSFCIYSIGSRTKKIKIHDFTDPIYFFDEAPKEF